MLFAGGKLDFLAAPPANSKYGRSGWNFNQAIPDANMELYSRNGTGANWNILLGFTHGSFVIYIWEGPTASH